MALLQRLFLAPATYVTWNGLVLLAVAATYPVDPYVFGFTTLVLGWISVVPAVAGIGVIFFAKQLSVTGRITIAFSVVIGASAIAVALEILRGFKWA